MKIVLVLFLNSILKVFHPELFFLAPLLLIFFLKQNKYFFVYLIVGSILDDFLAIRPLAFTLFVSSFSFLILTFLNRFVNSDKISGILLFLCIFLLMYFMAMGLLLHYQNPNYLAFVFLINVIYGAMVLTIYKIIT
ncbi:MAG: hypothetical protein AAB371_02260 [Patescibacteria group bacterium]